MYLQELQNGFKYFEKQFLAKSKSVLQSLKGERVKDHESLNQKANARIDDLKEKDDIAEQYSRRNCLDLKSTAYANRRAKTQMISLSIYLTL